MALTGAAISNLKRSIEDYIKDNLEDLENISIDYEGLPFSDTEVNEWIQPRIIDISTPFVRQSSSTEYGENANILYQFNVFVKKTALTISDREVGIRDLIAKYFKIGKDIPIYDYRGSSSNLGNARVREIVNDFPLSEKDTIMQYVFAIEIEYLKETVRP